jgi:hypothetical protein
MAQITRTVQVDGFGDGFKVLAYENKAGVAKVSMRVSVADLLANAKLAGALADQVVSFAWTPEQAADVAKLVPAANRGAFANAGVKVPATRRTK